MPDLPTIDPRTPNVYRLIIDTAQQIREQRQEQSQAMRMAARKLERIRMRAVASKFDSELDREIVQAGKVRRTIGRRLVQA